MRRKQPNMHENPEAYGEYLERQRAQQQSNDIYILRRAKEILIEQWAADRIAPEVRVTGEACLAAARHAIEEPAAHRITLERGAVLAVQQWEAEQGRGNRDF